MSGEPVWRGDWNGAPIYRNVAATRRDEPGLWFPLSARAELYEKIASRVAFDTGCDSVDAYDAAESILITIFGDEPDGGGSDA